MTQELAELPGSGKCLNVGKLIDILRKMPAEAEISLAGQHVKSAVYNEPHGSWVKGAVYLSPNVDIDYQAETSEKNNGNL